ncbi:MAG: hypothetical protein IKT84_04545 [Bacteroidales bacterium]|nr:hypothetical protein [Bacteroidales bacterium]
MIFAKKCMVKEIERIFVATFALLVATLLPAFVIIVATPLHIACLVATLCFLPKSFYFFLYTNACYSQAKASVNHFDKIPQILRNTIFASCEGKKSLDARCKCCDATSKAKLDDGLYHPDGGGFRMP